MATITVQDPTERVDVERIQELERNQNERHWKRQDSNLAKGLIIQWVGLMLYAIMTTVPWMDFSLASIHPHVWASIGLGAAILSLPLGMAYWTPGTVASRHTLAMGQMFFSSLLIHVMNGRIEAHFHVFGSLAFLAFYRDWKVLVTASLIVLLDHILRGVYWPQSIYGSSLPGISRTLEHGLWILFEDLFLIHACLKGQSEMREMAVQRAAAESEKSLVEDRIAVRTQELAEYGSFLKGVIEGIDAGICILDDKGVIVSTNSNWLNFSNSIDPEKSRIQVGINYVEVCRQATGKCAEGANQIADNIARVLKGETKTAVTEYSCPAKKDVRWFQVRVSKTLNPVRPGAIVVHLDVTQRMLALMELQEQKRQVDQLALVAQYTINGVMILDSDSLVTWSNDSSFRLLGCPRNEILGSAIVDLPFLAQASDEFRSSLRHAIEKKEAFRRELALHRPDQSGVVIDMEMQPVIVRGEHVAFIVNYIEITEQASIRQRLSSTFAAMAEGILVQDAQGIIIDCNPEAEAILKSNRSQLIGHTPDQGNWVAVFEDGSLWPMEDHPAMVTIRTGMPIRDAVMGIRHRDGNLRWISINTQVIDSKLGEADTVVSSFTDITTRRDQLQRLDLTISGAGLGVWDWNLHAGSVRFNSLFARILGYSTDELVPTRKFWESLIHPEDQTEAQQRLDAHMRGSTPDYRCEYRLRSKQGRWQWVQVCGRIVERDVNGNPVRMAGVHVDIAKLKEMESQLRASESKMRMIFDAALDAVFSLDEKGIITDWNLQASNIFGYERREAIGKWIKDVLFADQDIVKTHSWDCFQSEFKASTDLGRRFETYVANKAGRILTVEVAITSIQHNGEHAFSVFMKDITQQKQLESQVAQTQRLESIGQLASGVAHEINTPVQFVNDSVYFVREGVQDLFRFVDQLQALITECQEGKPVTDLVADAKEAESDADLEYLSDQIPKALDRSIEGLSRVAEIVRSMKEFAHQGTGQMNAVDLNHSLMSTLIVAKNEYKYVADIETDLGDIPEVICLGAEMNQVFLNLVVNAAHAVADVVQDSGRRGIIRITTKQVEDKVEISISDTGGGIPEKIRDRIFEPFFTTKGVGIGSGQGLTLAHNVVVKKHGGELKYHTEVGRGTTFYIRLPIDGSVSTAGVV